ncbi:MAG TPA: disulfide bond formation protein B [Sphingobium sp.]|nr:disulfide bond formation protein B [Sphingobium sp.]
MTQASVLLSRARLVAILLPVALLGGAIGSQYLGGLHPCEMCMWQRWPHLAAVGAALAAIALRRNPPMSATFTALAALAILTSGVIGAYHAGVEYGWWEGFTTCTTIRPIGGDMLEAIMNAPLIRCDQAPWTLAGISLAGFNALFSIAGAALILLLVRRWSRA